MKLDGAVSDELKKLYVPQGSVLGLLAYSVNIANLPEILPVHFYVDHVQFYKSDFPENSGKLVFAINHCLRLITNWSNNNGLKVNVTKMKVMGVGLRNCLTSSTEPE